MVVRILENNRILCRHFDAPAVAIDSIGIHRSGAGNLAL
jgi:hypothetical protein